MLPLSLQGRIQALLETVGSKETLVRSREELTKRYRLQQPGRAGYASSFEALAYIAARLPATYAALEAVLPHVPLKDVTSVLDMGAGPGTAALAAALHWPDCRRLHLIEGDAFMSVTSQKLLDNLPEVAHQAFSFQQDNLLTATFESAYDLVVLSYVLTELSPENQARVLKKAWDQARKGIVIITPGTPKGYQQLMGLRNQLMALGAFIAAPCPHQEACPLKEGDWCHFSTRLPRSALHREIKDVSLPFEDEKFSYLIAVRTPVSRPMGRIIREPLRRSGHIILDLCTSVGIQRKTLSRKDKDHYKAATKASWGEAWGET